MDNRRYLLILLLLALAVTVRVQGVEDRKRMHVPDSAKNDFEEWLHNEPLRPELHDSTAISPIEPSAMREVYERMKEKLEIIGINRDNPSAWKENDWSKKIVWKNWSDGKMGKGGIERHYCDEDAIPYYVLLSPDGRILWKNVGYGIGWFLGMAEAISGHKQDNSANLSLAVRHIDVSSESTTVVFRYYGKKDYWFRIVGDSYLAADGKKYRVTVADGIKLDENCYPQVKASSATEGIMGDMYYCDFTLTFEPFDTIPATFNFKEGDAQGAFVIRNITIEK